MGPATCPDARRPRRRQSGERRIASVSVGASGESRHPATVAVRRVPVVLSRVWREDCERILSKLIRSFNVLNFILHIRWWLELVAFCH